MNAIETRDLSKSFKGRYAVKNLNMNVPKGAIYGFIGENGAGKSTAQKMICGLLVPNEGKIELFGKPHNDADVRSRVGVLIENPGVYMGWTAYENLMMQALNVGAENPISEGSFSEQYKSEVLRGESMTVKYNFIKSVIPN